MALIEEKLALHKGLNVCISLNTTLEKIKHYPHEIPREKKFYRFKKMKSFIPHMFRIKCQVFKTKVEAAETLQFTTIEGNEHGITLAYLLLSFHFNILSFRTKIQQKDLSIFCSIFSVQFTGGLVMTVVVGVEVEETVVMVGAVVAEGVDASAVGVEIVVGEEGVVDASLSGSGGGGRCGQRCAGRCRSGGGV